MYPLGRVVGRCWELAHESPYLDSRQYGDSRDPAKAWLVLGGQGLYNRGLLAATASKLCL